MTGLRTHAARLGAQEEASYPAQLRVNDIRGQNLDRMLGDAAARRGWLLHQENMLVLPAGDLPELKEAAEDLTAWLVRDAALGGEPRPPSGSDLVNAMLDITGTGAQHGRVLFYAVILGVLGGALCLLLILLTAVELDGYLETHYRQDKDRPGPAAE